MKPLRALFFILLLGLAGQTVAQTYLNASARWYQRYSWTGFNANTVCYTTYHITGDTLVNDTLYYKVFNTGYCVNGTTEYDSLGNGTMVFDTTQNNSLYALLREQNKRFYKRQFTWNDELLSNFDLGTGGIVTDLVPYPSCGISNPSYTLLDTVCIGPLARKRWQISFSQYPLATYFIEGVGPSSGFLAPLCRNGCPECSYNLISFTLNGDTLYQGDCQLTLATNTASAALEWQQQDCQISCKAPVAGQLVLVSVDGRVLRQISTQAGVPASFAYQGLPAGMYVVHWQGNNGTRELRRIFHSGS